MPNHRSQRILIYLAAGLASVLLSLWYFHLKPVVNDDAVLYLLAAQGDADSAAQLGHWIFYSHLIHWASSLTGLKTEPAALLLNLLFDLALVLLFLRLLESLGATTRTLAIGAVAILVLTYLNDNRAEIIRDHGYWALTVAAMIFYLQLMKRFSWPILVAWYLCMGLATLFRVEGFAFLALMPLGLLLSPTDFRTRIKVTLKAYLPLIVGALLLAAFGSSELADNRLGQLLQNANTELHRVFIDTVDTKSRAIASALSPYYAQSAAVTVLAAAVAIDILRDLGTALTWPFFFILLLRNWFPAPGLPGLYRRALISYGVVSLLVLAYQELRLFIMVSRYTTALALLLLPVVAFSLDDLWQRYRSRQAPRWLAALVALSVLALAADSLIEKPGNKGYLLEAEDWAQRRLPENSRILTDIEVRRVYYYFNGRKPGQRQVTLFQPGRTQLKNFDFALTRSPHGPLAKVLEQGGAEKMASFAGRRGKPALLYRIPHEKEKPASPAVAGQENTPPTP